jgi:UDP-galactopyranose mutase
MKVLVVGAGPYGCVVANELSRSHQVTVIDRRDHIAGNAFDKPLGVGFEHCYGPHIFHTNNRSVWEFIQRFGTWRQYNHFVKAIGADGRFYSLPLSWQTLYEVYGDDWKKRWEKSKSPCDNPQNLEEFCLAVVGRDLYHLLFEKYTQKQWNRSCAELPTSIIKRLPIRNNWNTSYFSDRWCALPDEGYTQVFRNMLGSVETILGMDYREWKFSADIVFYSGTLDGFFNFKLGRLQYRSLSWTSVAQESQGCPVLNNCTDIPHTRTMEWEQFYGGCGNRVTVEEPSDTGEPIYPICDEANVQLARAYKKQRPKNVIFGGRLGSYQYYDMHQVIAQARKDANAIG